jgi:hypothetical protein
MRYHQYLNDVTTKIDDYLNDETFNEIKQLLIEMSLEQAIDFAEQMHKGQFRKGDKKPYVVHPQAVYSILKSFNIKDKVLLVAAWLHDTIEDTKATYNIIKRKFNKEVANLVKALSSDPREIAKQGKEQYLLNKMLKMSNNELTIKLADRLHNVTDIMSNPKAENVYLQTKYILDGLREKRNLKQVHKKIIKAIERYLNQYKPLNELSMQVPSNMNIEWNDNRYIDVTIGETELVVTFEPTKTKNRYKVDFAVRRNDHKLKPLDIFMAVLEVIKKGIKRTKATSIWLLPYDLKRSNIYQRIIDKFLPSGWTVETTDHPFEKGAKVFLLKKA